MYIKLYVSAYSYIYKPKDMVYKVCVGFKGFYTLTVISNQTIKT